MVIMMMGAQYTSANRQAGRCFLSFDLLPAIGAAAGDYLEWVDCSISDDYFPPTKVCPLPVLFFFNQNSPTLILATEISPKNGWFCSYEREGNNFPDTK